MNPEKNKLEIIVQFTDFSFIDKNILKSLEKGQVYLVNEICEEMQLSKFLKKKYKKITSTPKIVSTYNNQNYVFNFEEEYDSNYDIARHLLTFETKKEDYDTCGKVGPITLTKLYKNSKKKIIKEI